MNLSQNKVALSILNSCSIEYIFYVALDMYC